MDGSFHDSLYPSHKGKVNAVIEGEVNASQAIFTGYGLTPGKFDARWTLDLEIDELMLAWAGGEVVYWCVREGDQRASGFQGPTPDLNGEWHTVVRATGEPNGV